MPTPPAVGMRGRAGPKTWPSPSAADGAEPRDLDVRKSQRAPLKLKCLLNRHSRLKEFRLR